jgi:hypothetical protein
MPPEQYEGNVRSMMYEIFIEDEGQLQWLLSSDEAGAKFGQRGLDKNLEKEGRELRRELEEQGAVVKDISDISLAWIGILYDFTREDDEPFRAILDELEKDVGN